MLILRHVQTSKHSRRLLPIYDRVCNLHASAQICEPLNPVPAVKRMLNIIIIRLSEVVPSGVISVILSETNIHFPYAVSSRFIVNTSANRMGACTHRVT